MTATPPLEISGLHEAAGLLTADGHIGALNAGIARLRSEPEVPALKGKPFAALFEELSAPLAAQVLDLARQDGQWHGEVFFRDAQGGLVPVYLIVSRLEQSPRPAGDAEAPAFLFLALDFAAQHFAVSDQLRRQALLQRLWREAPFGVVAADSNSTIVQVNQEALELWAAAGIELLAGITLGEALQPLNPAIREAIETAREQGVAVRLEREPWAAATDRIVDLECLPQGRRGKLESLLLLVTDRTGELRLARQLRETERIASLGFMAANLSHELRNPLQALQGALERLQQMTAEPLSRSGLAAEDQAAIGETITRGLAAVERMAGILQPVLDLARSAAPQVQRVPVRALLERAREGVVHHRRLAGITVEVDLAVDAGDVSTDPALVQQILTNLLINAAQALKGQGSITLRGAAGRGAEEAVVQVQDSGPGIAPADQAHLFTPFFTTKPVGEGTGLGLYASQALALQLGGWLGYRADLAPGACFELTLPREYSGPAPGADAGWSPRIRLPRSGGG